MYRATVTYLSRGYERTTVVTTNAPSRIAAGRAINRYMVGLRSDCNEIGRTIEPSTPIHRVDATFLRLIGRVR